MSRFGKPKTTEHGYFEERLSAYLDGELLPQERDAVEKHLSTCQDCQWDLETLSKTVQWTRELPTVPVPRVFTIPVPAAPQRAARRRWSFVPALQAATAVVALLLFFAVTGDVLLGGFRMASAPALDLMEQPPPGAADVTQIVEMAQQAPLAATEAVEAIVVETVVVEMEVERAVEVQAEKQVVQPTPAPLSTSAPQPAAAEAAEVAPDEAVPAEPPAGAPEGESQEEALGLGGASPTVEMEAPVAAGGEPEAMALSAPPSPTAQPTAWAAAEMEDEAAEQPALASARTGALRQPVNLGLRIIEYSLGALLLLLVTATAVAMVQRRRSRSG